MNLKHEDIWDIFGHKVYYEIRGSISNNVWNGFELQVWDKVWDNEFFIRLVRDHIDEYKL